jgi:hypothetical protein
LFSRVQSGWSIFTTSPHSTQHVSLLLKRSISPSTDSMSDDTTDIGIWSAVEPNLGVVGACLPLMAPLFRKVKEMSTKKSSHGSSSDRSWNHTRLQEDQTRATQQHWPKVPRGSAMPADAKSDDVPLTNHWERTEASSDNGVGNSVRHDIEMQAFPKTPTDHNHTWR